MQTQEPCQRENLMDALVRASPGKPIPYFSTFLCKYSGFSSHPPFFGHDIQQVNICLLQGT